MPWSIVKSEIRSHIGVDCRTLKSQIRSLAVVGDVGAGPFHVGDEAMLEANLAVLRRQDPHARITVIGRGAALGAADLADVDGLFISGGGNLSSSWPDLLRQRIQLMLEARRRGIPIVTGGQTIGPELAMGERSALAAALAEVEHLGVRELPSVALALQMGVPPHRLSYQPDDAFFLPGCPPAEEPAKEKAAAIPDEPFLAVTLDPTFAVASLSSLATQLARFAAESRLRLAFLPHVGPLGSLGDEDGRAGTALCQLLRAEGVECALLPVMSPAATVWVTQRAALVVSSRYHPLVFGTAAAVPCLGIHRDAYTRIKLQGALAHVGMDAWCLSAEAAEGGGLLAALRRLWAGREEARAAMTRARAFLELQEEPRWRRLLARLGWLPEPDEAPEATPLGWPAERLAGAALAALGLERQASEAETGRLRGIVKSLERAVDLAGPIVWGRRTRSKEMSAMLTEQQWNDYSRDGFLHLGKVLEPEQVENLTQRADDLALGNVGNSNVQMQLDTGGAYEELPGAVRSFEHGTMLYRKIQGLETDDLFSRLVRHPLFLEVCGRQYGRHAAISIFRAMVMNKPAGQGTVLPWHQDGGDVWALDRDPLVTVWVALDPATRANGCLEVIPGSHNLGLLSLYGSTVAEEDVARHCPPDRVQPIEVEAGHAVLLHNWLIHRSGVNPTPVPRRAFTICYMDGRTQSTLTGNHFPLMAGSLPSEPYPFVRELQKDGAALRETVARAEEFVASLQEENRLLQESSRAAAAYARSLEEEMARLREMREETERYAKSLEADRERRNRPWPLSLLGKS
jgi:polysaccharide pyruvyl transferase WcaK-like protein